MTDKGLLRTLDDLLEALLRRAWTHRRPAALLLAAGLGAWACWGPAAAPAPPPLPLALAATDPGMAPLKKKALVGRVWIDRIPRDHRDKIRVYFFAPEKNVGVHLTLHSHTWMVQELFQYRLGEGKVGFRFFDPKVEVRSPAKLRKLGGEEHVDMELTLGSDPQAKGGRYRYLRLKKKHAAALGLPDLATLEAMAARAATP